MAMDKKAVGAELNKLAVVAGPASHPYQIGEKLVVVAEGGLFVKGFGSRLGAAEAAGLFLVELTITEEVVVPGDYRPEEMHYGYRAKGSDGWNYECQAERFDDCAMSPYQNWHRSYVKDVHYKADAAGGIGKWLVDKSEFDGHYLNWDITHVIRGLDNEGQDALAQRVNAAFPDCAIEKCDKVTLNSGGKPVNHAEFGWHYVKSGCSFCRMLAKEAETVAALG